MPDSVANDLVAVVLETLEIEGAADADTVADAALERDATGEKEAEEVAVVDTVVERLRWGEKEALAETESLAEIEADPDARADAVINDALAEPVAVRETAGLLETDGETEVVEEVEGDAEREAVAESDLVANPDTDVLGEKVAAGERDGALDPLDVTLGVGARVPLVVALCVGVFVGTALLVPEAESDCDKIDEGVGNALVTVTLADEVVLESSEALGRDERDTAAVFDELAVALVEKDGLGVPETVAVAESVAASDLVVPLERVAETLPVFDPVALADPLSKEVAVLHAEVVTLPVDTGEVVPVSERVLTLVPVTDVVTVAVASPLREAVNDARALCEGSTDLEGDAVADTVALLDAVEHTLTLLVCEAVTDTEPTLTVALVDCVAVREAVSEPVTRDVPVARALRLELEETLLECVIDGEPLDETEMRDDREGIDVADVEREIAAVREVEGLIVDFALAELDEVALADAESLFCAEVVLAAERVSLLVAVDDSDAMEGQAELVAELLRDSAGLSELDGDLLDEPEPDVVGLMRDVRDVEGLGDALRVAEPERDGLAVAEVEPQAVPVALTLRDTAAEDVVVAVTVLVRVGTAEALGEKEIDGEPLAVPESKGEFDDELVHEAKAEAEGLEVAEGEGLMEDDPVAEDVTEAVTEARGDREPVVLALGDAEELGDGDSVVGAVCVSVLEEHVVAEDVPVTISVRAEVTDRVGLTVGEREVPMEMDDVHVTPGERVAEGVIEPVRETRGEIVPMGEREDVTETDEHADNLGESVADRVAKGERVPTGVTVTEGDLVVAPLAVIEPVMDGLRDAVCERLSRDESVEKEEAEFVREMAPLAESLLVPVPTPVMEGVPDGDAVMLTGADAVADAETVTDNLAEADGEGVPEMCAVKEGDDEGESDVAEERDAELDMRPEREAELLADVVIDTFADAVTDGEAVAVRDLTVVTVCVSVASYV